MPTAYHQISHNIVKKNLGEFTMRVLGISSIWSHLFVPIIPFGMTQNALETIILLQIPAKQEVMRLNNPALKSIKSELTNLAIRHLMKHFIVMDPKLAFHMLMYVTVQ